MITRHTCRLLRQIKVCVSYVYLSVHAKYDIPGYSRKFCHVILDCNLHAIADCGSVSYLVIHGTLVIRNSFVSME